MKRLFLATLIFAALTGCESDETNQLAKAQECLDNVSSTSPTDANDCMSYVSDLDSQQANIIKCSIKFLAGGLTTPRITEAYKYLKDNDEADKEAYFITVLALNPVSAATEAVKYCKKSGVNGLIYLANLSVVGSNLLNGIGFNINTDGTPDATDVQDALDTCSAGGTGGVCDDAAIGNAVISISESYCASAANKNSDVCTKINAAIDAAGTDPAAIALQIYALLDN